VPTATLAERRTALLANARALLKLDWTATKDPAALAAQGDVVWDNVTQTGYMRFAGLAPNDPAKQQYQLWIFDAERGDKYPVDGGVFDVPAGQTEVLVPISAKLKVIKPAMFAVTVERPGGVVVSGRERIVVLAQVSAG
jgi:anti-sigma-K factor RskA